MDIQLLSAKLNEYSRLESSDKQKFENEALERKDAIKFYKGFTKQKILNLDTDGIYEFLAPLWALKMWGNRHTKIDALIADNGLDKLKKLFAELLYGKDKLEKRWDSFRKNVHGVGPAIMSELLSKIYPKEFIIWNRKTNNAFLQLGINNIPRYESRLDGKNYVVFCDTAKEMLKESKKVGITDMLHLDYFMWEMFDDSIPLDSYTTPEKTTTLKKSKKDSNFDHNDIRDKVREIGEFLGFKASIEKKVADGAVVDALWEATIGNMGRVIYVFEVQTSGSIDSLILNLIKAHSNKAVQGIVAVSDSIQLEKIKKEVKGTSLDKHLKYLDYTEILKIHESLQYATEKINTLGLVPDGF